MCVNRKGRWRGDRAEKGEVRSSNYFGWKGGQWRATVCSLDLFAPRQLCQPVDTFPTQPCADLTLARPPLAPPLPALFLHYDHPCQMLHMRQNYWQQVGGVPGPAAGGVLGGVSMRLHGGTTGLRQDAASCRIIWEWLRPGAAAAEHLLLPAAAPCCRPPAACRPAVSHACRCLALPMLTHPLQ